MWLLNFITTSFLLIIVHGILLLGLLGFIVSYLVGIAPPIKLYDIPIRIVSCLIILCGIYLEGELSSKKYYENQIATIKQKIIDAQNQSTQINTTLTGQLQVKDQQITTLETELHKKIKQNTIIIDKNCTVDPNAIDILNAAAQSPTATPTGTPP